MVTDKKKCDRLAGWLAGHVDTNATSGAGKLFTLHAVHAFFLCGIQ